VAFSPHGKALVTGSYDGTAKIWHAFDWNLSPEELQRQKRQRYRRWLDKDRTGTQLAYDGFDRTLSLAWKIVHPDASRYSLTKNPGTLTITTQEGGFARSSTNYKNLFLIDCPAGAGGDVQITTHISPFKAVAEWNQAGLICYNHDDNYLKWDCEKSTDAPAVFALGRETQGRFETAYFDTPPDKLRFPSLPPSALSALYLDGDLVYTGKLINAQSRIGAVVSDRQ